MTLLNPEVVCHTRDVTNSADFYVILNSLKFKKNVLEEYVHVIVLLLRCHVNAVNVNG